jgi:hypothetical protein
VQAEAVLNLHGVDGNVYTSSSFITLSWWRRGKPFSDIEKFYITEDLPRDCHAMLRRAPDDDDHSNTALPLFNKAQTAGKLPP